MPVYRLDNDLWFPDPYRGEPNGLVAVGGDLSPERLLLAYSNGFFPWFSFRYYSEPQWYCPLDRFVIFPGEIHVSHSMRTLINQQKYEVTFNQDFEGVIHGCATTDGRNRHGGAWLGQQMIDAYTELHRKEYVISVEVWQPHPEGRKLVGGLYGVALGKGFFGESMFSRVPNASKLALIALARTLENVGCALIDCQFETPHLLSMGGRHISYEKYIELLN